MGEAEAGDTFNIPSPLQIISDFTQYPLKLLLEEIH